MAKPVLSGAYFILPDARDADRREEIAREERFVDFVRGYVCGAITMITLATAVCLAALWLA